MSITLLLIGLFFMGSSSVAYLILSLFDSDNKSISLCFRAICIGFMFSIVGLLMNIANIGN